MQEVSSEVAQCRGRDASLEGHVRNEKVENQQEAKGKAHRGCTPQEQTTTCLVLPVTLTFAQVASLGIVPASKILVFCSFSYAVRVEMQCVWVRDVPGVGSQTNTGGNFKFAKGLQWMGLRVNCSSTSQNCTGNATQVVPEVGMCIW